VRIGRNDRNPLDRERADQPLWLQAGIGIGLVTAGALLAILVGVVMAAVVTWLF
jgi:hypothetical protein